MMKLGMSVGILATVFCLSVRAQTINVMTLDQAGAQTALQTARESAQQRNAPSAIAVVDPAGDLLAFQRMVGVRPGKCGSCHREGTNGCAATTTDGGDRGQH